MLATIDNGDWFLGREFERDMMKRIEESEVSAVDSGGE